MDEAKKFIEAEEKMINAIKEVSLLDNKQGLRKGKSTYLVKLDDKIPFHSRIKSGDKVLKINIITEISEVR